MTLVRVTPPSMLPVTEESVWDFLRLDISGSPAEPVDRAEVLRLIRAGTDALDGADGWLGRALVRQTWRLALDAFPRWEIALPLPPLRSVDSVVYLDTSGTETTLSADQYHVAGVDGDGRLVPVTSWPSAADRPEAVRITFTCGYSGDGGSPEDLAANVPAPIKDAIRRMVADAYECRTTVTFSHPHTIPGAADLSRFRVWRC